MRNTEDVTDTSSISDGIRNNKAINSASANAISADIEPLIVKTADEKAAEYAAKKKKYIKIGLCILGGIAVILAIVLPLTLGKHKDPIRPDPIGPNPLPAGVMNPYNTVMQRSSQNGHMIYGQLLLMDLNKTILHDHASQVVPRQLFLQSEEAVSKQIGVDWRNKNFFGANNDFKRNLTYQLNTITGDSFHLKITTANETRYSIPTDQVNARKPSLDYRLELYGLQLYDQTKENFGFELHDVINPTNWFFDTRNQTFIFADKYIQMDFKLASQNVYGLGDRQGKLKLEPGALNMWASGQPSFADDGKGRSGLSGVHPFVMFEGKESRRYVGLFFRNSAAMTPVLKFNNDSTSTLSFITIGGDIDLYVFIKGTAKEVVEAYHSMIRPPYLPPFWALGWQEVPPNGFTQQNILDAVKSYKDNNLPLDSYYLPASSWDNEKDFQLNTSQITDVKALKQTLAQQGKKLVAYLDAAVSVQNRNQNPAYTACPQCFIKSGQYKDQNPDGYLVNKKGAKNVVYYDWFNDGTKTQWNNSIQKYFKDVGFDGLWTTENEPFSNTPGEIKLAQSERAETHRLLEEQPFQAEPDPDVDQSWFYSFWPLNRTSTFLLPFIPQYQRAGNYDNWTISLNATHTSGVTEYDVHNLYAHAMMKTTFASFSLALNDTRPFLLTRGSYSSTGRYASQPHETRVATYDTLYYALQSALRSQLFGMSHSGADVACNATSEKTFDAELCLRFYQLSAWFPLARHVYTNTQSAPYNFIGDTMNSIKETMHSRMQYLRMLYTCLQEVNDVGGTCLQPLSFLYDIPAAQADNDLIDKTFMVGRALKISPILMPLNGQKVYQSYFPAGKWVNMADWAEIIQGADNSVTISVRTTANVHLAPGAMIPFQNNARFNMMSTAEVLAAPIMLVANRDQYGYAYGGLTLDQGISRKEIDDNEFEYYNIYVQANSIQFKPDDEYDGKQPHILDKIALVNAADLSQVDFACFYRPDSLTPVEMTPFYDASKKALTLTPKGESVKFSEIENIYYGSKAKGDLNLCAPENAFQYQIISTSNPYPQNLTNITGLKNVTFELKYIGNAHLDNVKLSLSFFDTGILNIKWSWADPSGKRKVFPVPDEVVNSTGMRDLSNLVDTLEKHVSIYNDPQFRLEVRTRISPKQAPTVFSLSGFLFHEYMNWVQMEAQAEKADTEEEFHGVFGLGERSQKEFFMKTGVYSMWSTDANDPLEDGRLPGKQVYGSHPFYMWKHSSNNWIGIYHNNANAQDWWINNDFTTGKVSISQIATGGLSDLYVMLPSQNPEGIIAKYHSLIGTPVLTPQWALGWHQCKWCYRTLEDVQTSLNGYLENEIPLDAQWVDVDYMQNYKDFTYNQADYWGQPGGFFGLQEFIDFLHHDLKKKFVPIIDAGISYRPNEGYTAFDDGLKQGVFMKDQSGKLAYGKVWPNEAVFPDFSHPNANDYWSDQLTKFSKIIQFDGLWQDMNEASNFCNGKCFKDEDKQGSSIVNKLPYTPTGKRLEKMALPLDSTLNDGRSQLDAHSLYGTLQSRSSSLWYQQQKQRPFIISRSSFAGHGKYASHWLGDNHALTEDMTISVVSVMKFNMFGIPMVGADICGFGGPNTTAELCARWHQVGAFQPFSRNHRNCESPQEPWRFNDTYFDSKTNKTSYMDIMKRAIQRKYHLIRYYYTEMSQLSFGNNTQYTVYKPLFFEFPEDTGAYNDIPNNVMIGKALKTSVNAVNLTQTETEFYFPAGTWCSLFEPVGECITTEIGQTWPLPSTLNDSFVHLREGFIVPLQDATALRVNTTGDLQSQPVDLHILGQYRVPGVMTWAAEGLYVNDDGLTTDLNGNVNQYYMKASYTQQQTSETITIQFAQRMLATNYYNNVTNCSAVNTADWLQNLYIYNADSFKSHDAWLAMVSYTDADPGDYFAIGTAWYDKNTNRIVLDNRETPDQWVCLTRVFRLVLKAQG